MVHIVGLSGPRDWSLTGSLGSWSGSGARGKRAPGQGPLLPGLGRQPALGGAASQGKRAGLFRVGAWGGSASVATHPTHGNTEAQSPRLSGSPEFGLEALRSGRGGWRLPCLDLGGNAALRGRATLGEPASWLGRRLSSGLWPGTLRRRPVAISSNGPLLPLALVSHGKVFV